MHTDGEAECLGERSVSFPPRPFNNNTSACAKFHREKEQKKHHQQSPYIASGSAVKYNLAEAQVKVSTRFVCSVFLTPAQSRGVFFNPKIKPSGFF